MGQPEEKIKAVMFLGLAIVMAGVSLYAGLTIGPIQGMFAVPVIVFLLYLGWVEYSAWTDDRRIADERSQWISERSASNAFWFLLGLIVIQNGFHVVPEQFTAPTYLIVGSAVVLIYQVYYRVV